MCNTKSPDSGAAITRQGMEASPPRRYGQLDPDKDPLIPSSRFRADDLARA
ncbi:hypothetical protein [Nitrosospira briensis]|uniref:hypothetical protein n=1 Tax=Nitrosospira briensis TaxID=35799 RepID=UPI0015A620EE|nr:hypothetical protein [Nitrosospira briensis]